MLESQLEARTRGRPPLDAGPSIQHARYWATDSACVAAVLDTDLQAGLTSEEAARRLQENGPNELRTDEGQGPLRLLLGQFRSLVVWVLAAAAVLAGFIGEPTDSVAIAAILVLNALIGFYQEFHAERSLAALRKMSAPVARVVRDGRPMTVPAACLVPGDVLLLSAGDLPAADARLVEGDSLQASEASLTGESEPVEKDPAAILEPETPLADRRNMVYLGTSIVRGTGRAVVTATGLQTEIGRVARLLRGTDREETPLQRRLEQVGRWLLLASLAIVGLVFVLGLLRGQPAGRMLLTAISLAVAAVPEGLPAAVTIALALGVGRMARRHALVRRLAAVETLGSAQVICTDKTGTLTRNEMTARLLWAGGSLTELPDGPLPPLSEAARRTLWIAAGCNEAVMVDGHVAGHPTEAALLVAAARAGFERARIEAECPRVRVIPFESSRKRMVVVRRTPEGEAVLVKGAPDVVVALCTRWYAADGTVVPLDPDARGVLTVAYEGLAAQAYRVLAFACRERAAGTPPDGPDEVDQDLTFAGLIALQDPLRPEAAEAVRRCREAGIRVVMITGDHPNTAVAIARQLDILGPDDRVMTGAELQRTSDEALRALVPHVAVYARVAAEDKLRIVRALRSHDLVVAMTGDGVNDAPALREASIGVAMGGVGTEVAREASDVVVTDDNFASIVAAVEEGRRIYDNIRKCLQYLLAGNVGEILIVLAAVLAGWPIPLLPIHLLWINLVTDGLPALALAADPLDPASLRRPPRPAGARMADPALFRSVLLVGALTASVALLAFWYGQGSGQPLDVSRSYAFSALVFAELLRAVGARSAALPFWRADPLASRGVLAVVAISLLLQMSIPHVPPLRTLFRIEPLPLEACVVLLILGALPMLLLEAAKEARCRLRPPLRAATS